MANKMDEFKAFATHYYGGDAARAGRRADDIEKLAGEYTDGSLADFFAMSYDKINEICSRYRVGGDLNKKEDWRRKRSALNLLLRLKRFPWIPFYMNFADNLLRYKNDRSELVAFIKENFSDQNHLKDENPKGNIKPIGDICPFTVMGIFNRGITSGNKQNLIERFSRLLGLEDPAPESFNGIPTLFNSKSLFYEFEYSRGENDIDLLWAVFEQAILYADNKADKADFVKAFDNAITSVKGTAKVNLSMGLYWIRPFKFVSLDKNSRGYMERDFGITENVSNGEEYIALTTMLKDKFGPNSKVRSFAEIATIDATAQASGVSESKKDYAESAVPENKPASTGGGNVKLNQILYGPPGTGKTYATINRALEIVDGDIPVSREKQLARFNELKQAGQIELVTFHQGYAYEDFIEGIKPVLDEENISYKLEDGVFKRISDIARKNKDNAGKGEHFDVEELVQKYAGYVEDRLNRDESVYLIPDEKVGEIAEVSYTPEGEFRSFIARHQYQSRHRRSLTLGTIVRDYEKFKIGEIADSEDVAPVRSDTIIKKHPLSRLYYALYQRIQEFEKEDGEANYTAERVDLKRYVLIIDEINRGNIAKIFGELITLIEDSKRFGQNDALELTLPYSKESFSVPDNLYIIGTMNTADRSIALLDTALRRRFAFEEVMPEPTRLDKEAYKEVSLPRLLTAINERITALYDREHQIGHAYLMGIANIGDLKNAFQHKIIPLLKEYFFEDWDNIDIVLNKNGFVKSRQNPHRGDEYIYDILSYSDGKWDSPDAYRKIYQAGAGEEGNEEPEDNTDQS